VKKVLVIGSSGMLGSSLKSQLLKSRNEIYFTRRDTNSKVVANEFIFDFIRDDLKYWFDDKPRFDFVINCIGAIPQKYPSGSDTEIRQMIELNSLLPQFLKEQSNLHGFQIIQIATDCVFSGKSGKYTEESIHDASDIYGVTKSLGEKYVGDAMTLRCSIIGRNDHSNSSLHNWVLSNQLNATISGYRNHIWNGITTVAFARIVKGIIDNGLFETGLQHVLPSDEVTKNELIRVIAQVNNRTDLKIMATDHEMTIDRTLKSLYPEKNQLLWRSAGYEKIPSISELVIEMDA
jgi:dTDP-4-dehydrorhamnose reductase